jgi:predicted transcriptional regulator
LEEQVILRDLAHNPKVTVRNLRATQNIDANYREHMNTLMSWGLVRKTEKRNGLYKLTVRGKAVLKYLDELDEKTDNSWTTSIGTVREMDKFCVCVMHQKKL